MNVIQMMDKLLREVTKETLGDEAVPYVVAANSIVRAIFSCLTALTIFVELYEAMGDEVTEDVIDAYCAHLIAPKKELIEQVISILDNFQTGPTQQLLLAGAVLIQKELASIERREFDLKDIRETCELIEPNLSVYVSSLAGEMMLLDGLPELNEIIRPQGNNKP